MAVQNKSCTVNNTPFMAVVEGWGRKYHIVVSSEDGKKHMRFITEVGLPNITDEELRQLNLQLKPKFAYKTISVFREKEQILCEYEKTYSSLCVSRNKYKLYRTIIENGIEIVNSISNMAEELLSVGAK